MSDAPLQRKPDDPIKGRGSSFNPVNRFEKIELELDLENYDTTSQPAKTEYFVDHSKTILSYNDSPDIGFSVGLNPYRGCEHGCIYCYARPTHEYFGLSSGLDFESKIFVKKNAPELLRTELLSKKWMPQVIAFSGITDVYQPVERKLQLTRQCLEVLAEFRNPVGMITKNHLITRDIDLLKELAEFDAVCAFISVTSLDGKLGGILEPRASRPWDRLDAIKKLSDAGIPVGCMVAPVIPGLTDHEIPKILEAARDSGARWAGYTLVRLPYAIKDLFAKWLEDHFPDRKEKVLNRIRSMRGGKLNDPNFGSRMRGEGIFSDQIKSLFALSCKRAGINQTPLELSEKHFRKPPACQVQMTLFDS